MKFAMAFIVLLFTGQCAQAQLSGYTPPPLRTIRAFPTMNDSSRPSHVRVHDSSMFLWGQFKDPAFTLAPITVYNQGLADAFVAKMNDHGETQWIYQLGGCQNELIRDLKFDPQGRLWLTATLDLNRRSVLIRLDPQTGLETFRKEFGIGTLLTPFTVDNEGAIYVGGYWNGRPGLHKLDSLGQWVKTVETIQENFSDLYFRNQDERIQVLSNFGAGSILLDHVLYDDNDKYPFSGTRVYVFGKDLDLITASGIGRLGEFRGTPEFIYSEQGDILVNSVKKYPTSSLATENVFQLTAGGISSIFGLDFQTFYSTAPRSALCANENHILLWRVQSAADQYQDPALVLFHRKKGFKAAYSLKTVKPPVAASLNGRIMVLHEQDGFFRLTEVTPEYPQIGVYGSPGFYVWACGPSTLNVTNLKNTVVDVGLSDAFTTKWEPSLDSMAGYPNIYFDSTKHFTFTAKTTSGDSASRVLTIDVLDTTVKAKILYDTLVLCQPVRLISQYPLRKNPYDRWLHNGKIFHQQNDTIWVTEPGQYVLSMAGINVGLCDLTKDSVDVQEPFTFSLSTAPDTICAGQDAVINISGPAGISYSSPQGVPSGQPFTACHPGPYLFTGTDVNGCSVRRSIQLPVRNFKINTWPIIRACRQEPVTAGLPFNPSMQYFWDGVRDSSVILLHPNADSTFRFTVVDSLGCRDSMDYYLYVKPADNPQVTSPDTNLCFMPNKYLQTLHFNGSGGAFYKLPGVPPEFGYTTIDSSQAYLYDFQMTPYKDSIFTLPASVITYNGCVYNRPVTFRWQGPFAQPRIGQTGGKLFVIDSAAAGNTYDWYLNGQLILQDSDTLFNPENGSYLVQSRNGDCVVHSDTLALNVLENSQAVYPNPFHDEIILDLVTNSPGQVITYKLSNSLGATVWESPHQQPLVPARHPLRIQGLAHLPRGLYFLQIILSTERYVFKLMKE